MRTYSVQERIDMILTIGESQENCLLASRVYAQKYPDRNHPDKRVLQKLLEVFRRTGSVAYQKVNRPKLVTEDYDNEFQVIGSIIENPHASQREISREIGISRRSVGRIIKRHKFHPYHIQLHQELQEEDFDRRLEYCLWALERVGEDEHFFDFVLFTDECTFHNTGFVNRHNYHYYSDKNPHFLRTVDRQHRWSVNVWGGIVGLNMIGPYFFDGNLNGQKFRRFLQDNLPELLEDIAIDVRRRMWLQLDGAPAHFELRARECLNRSYPNKWIGRGGPENWPARSPDLTCLDFFLWGYIKNIVYNTPPTTPNDMKQRITNAFATIGHGMLTNVKRSYAERILLCIAQNGRQFEHLL